MKNIIVVGLLLVLAACVGKTPPVVEELVVEELVVEEPVVEEVSVKLGPLVPVAWSQIDGWQQENPAVALEVFRKSCRAVARRQRWTQVCAEAELVDATEAAAREYFERFFQPHQVRNEDGSDAGMITGYYGPELLGSRTPTEKYRFPLYTQPEDLLIIDLDEIYPDLGDYRLRGRVVGNRVVPYFQREEIDNGNNPLQGNELFWVADPVDLFFLHIQGSGRIRLPNDEVIMVGYANQNGHRYRSIGKLLLERKAMNREQMSMQNIRKWVEQNPAAGKQLLAENPSYVFFRELSSDYTFPPGALGIPLTERRSLAVDPRTIPLGAPVFLATTFPGSEEPLEQLMVAQDTGGAIKGQVRADFFWGMGAEAGSIAGRMKQQGRLWVLLPKEEVVPGEGVVSQLIGESLTRSN